MKSGTWISSMADLHAARKKLSRTFQLENSLPDKVFVDSIQKFSFIEFDVLLSPGFWPFLKEQMCLADSEFLFLWMTEPSAEAYFQNHDRFGVLRFAADTAADEYYQAIFESPDGSEPDALGFLARSVAISDGSGAWGVWGDRDLGIAAFGTSLLENARCSSTVRWLGFDQAVEVMSTAFKNRVIPSSFVRRFQQAYMFR